MFNKIEIIEGIKKKAKHLEDKAKKLRNTIEERVYGSHGGIANDDHFRRLLLNNERLGIRYSTTWNAITKNKNREVFLLELIRSLASTGDPLTNKLLGEYESHQCFNDSAGLQEVLYKMASRTLAEREYKAYLNRSYPKSSRNV